MMHGQKNINLCIMYYLTEEGNMVMECGAHWRDQTPFTLIRDEV